MIIRQAYKFRIYPNKEQEARLAIQFGHNRFVYNHFRAKREQVYKETGKGLSWFDCNSQLPTLKAEFEWLKEADSQTLQQSLKDLDRAYQNFFAKRADYPRFKSRHDKQSIRYPQRFKLNEGKIYLPKVGWVKVIQHRTIEGKMKNCTVSKTKSGKYFVSIQCERNVPEPQYTGDTVGVDLGLSHFAITSKGEKIENPRHLRKSEKRLKRLQRTLSRKKRGSNNRSKARLELARQHEKVANQRRDFHHKLSRRLVEENQLLGLESLNITGMVKNHKLAKSISDAGWGQFVQFCTYKGQWYGCNIVQVDPFFPSSKQCSECGYCNVGLTLKDREWDCPACGTYHDRDINASVNIEAESKRHTVGATEIHACGDMREVTLSAQEAQPL